MKKFLSFLLTVAIIICAVPFDVIVANAATNSIVPQGNAQRCKVAKIMYNIFLKNIF